MAKKKATETDQEGAPFFFPERGVTLYPADREAAEKQLEATLKEEGEASA